MRIELVYVEPPLEQIRCANERRQQRAPQKAIERLIERLEPPTWDGIARADADWLNICGITL